MDRIPLFFAIGFLLGLALGLPLYFQNSGTGEQPVNQTFKLAQSPNNDRGVDKQVINRQVERFLKDNPGLIMDIVEQNQEQRPERQAQGQQDQQRQQGQNNKQAEKLAEQRDNDHVYGNSDAPISLIEYSDFQCPFCQRFHPIARKLADQSNGEINSILRHLPLPMHNNAVPMANAAECAYAQKGEDAFWTFAHAFLEDEAKLSQIDNLAKEAGLDLEQFKECQQETKFADKINKSKQEAQSAGINATPGMILVNKETGDLKVLSGLTQLPELKRQVDQIR